MVLRGLWVLALLAGCGHGEASLPTWHAQSQPNTLSLLTYNIWGKPGVLGKDKQPRLERLAKALGGDDVVTLQEAFTQYSSLLFPSYPFSHWQNNKSTFHLSSGLMTLSRHAIGQTAFQPFGDCTWSTADCFANKGVLFTRLDVPGVGAVDLYNTHYQAETRGGRTRLSNNRDLIRFIQQHDAGHPTVITGDFNMLPGSPEYLDLVKQLPLRDAWHALHPDSPGPTYDPANPHVRDSQSPQRLDYVFVLGPADLQKAELAFQEPVQGMVLSDHYGLRVRLAF